LKTFVELRIIDQYLADWLSRKTGLKELTYFKDQPSALLHAKLMHFEY